MAEMPDKLDLQSHHISNDKKGELLKLFPEVETEGGKIDFEKLKLTLGETVDVGKERYGMNWPGKAECFKTIQQPSMATLIPSKSESVNFDETENLIIEGDNLEVLKLLQKSYMGKVKMIYIDPPYNTGNDFIYPDNYSESLETYLEYTGQVDNEGRKFSTNTETDGRFHSKWMNMMYPRLFLARNLLKDDGVVFISIDDHEIDNLKKVCNEIFGEENFISQIVWEKMYTTKNDSSLISQSHEYLIVCSKNLNACSLSLLPRTTEMDERYNNPDSDPRGPWKPIPLYAKGERKNGRYKIISPITKKEHWPETGKHWLYVEKDVKEMIADNRIWFGKDGNSQPNVKRFLSEVQQGSKIKSLWKYSEVGSNDSAKKEIRQLFPEFEPFDFPKPVTLIMRMLQIMTFEKNDDIIFDFFAGSGTTAQAVLEINKLDNGNRKFILVQLPEAVEKEKYKTIAEITKERVRRAIKKVNDENSDQLQFGGESDKQDRGFKVFKLQSSNFKVWNTETTADTDKLGKQMELHVDHILKDRSQDDILYEILLKSGYELTTKVEILTMAGKKVHAVHDGSFFICLEKELNLEVIRAMAEKKPERVVCLDEGFAGNDQLKTNAVQTFKSKGVTSFRTI